MADPEFVALAKATSAKAKKVKPPVPPSAEAKALLKAEQERLGTHLTSLVPALMFSPIYLVSSHGAYDLRNEPVTWTVPPNTYIFETQTIGDTTLTTIDNLLWKLCMPKYRPAFFNYFMGNRSFFDKMGKKPLKTFIELFRNLILYKPGDEIYERQLSIGGGHTKEGDGSARHAYVNMGFYKFSVNPPTPNQEPPKISTTRPMAPTEIPDLNPLRTELVNNDDFIITNREFVDLINSQTPIIYGGLANLHDAQTFTFDDDGESVRIFIFSSCAAVNCNPPKPHTPWPPVDLPEKERKAMEKAYEAARKAAYKSEECNERIDRIERHQRSIILEMSEMGIHTGPGGSGWDLDIDTINDVILSTPDLRLQTKTTEPQMFLPGVREELFAELDSDLADWWISVEEAPDNFNSKAVRNTMEGGRRKKKGRTTQRLRLRR